MTRLAHSETQRLRGRKGQERRARWLQHFPLCEACKKAGKVRQADEVDHIKPLLKGGPDDESNFQSLCKDCHRDKTNADMGYTQRKVIGQDGWPVDG